MDVLVALIALGLGLVALFFGFRLFLLLLPVWGALVGFLIGASFVAWLLGEGFLSSILGIVVGVVVGIGGALISVVWWWVGVVIAIGGFGFAIGYGVLPELGLDVGVLNLLVGLAIGVVFAVAAVVLRLPRLFVVTATALWGAGAVLAGVLIFLDEIQPEAVGYGAVDAVVATSLLWLIVYLGLAIVGAVAQLATSEDIALTPPDGRPASSAEVP